MIPLNFCESQPTLNLLVFTGFCDTITYLNVTGLERFNFTSPNYPGSIPTFVECRWVISAADDGYPMAEFVKLKLVRLVHPLHIYNSSMFHSAQPDFSVRFGTAPRAIMSYSGVLGILFRSNNVPAIGQYGFVIEISSQPINRRYLLEAGFCI